MSRSAVLASALLALTAVTAAAQESVLLRVAGQVRQSNRYQTVVYDFTRSDSFAATMSPDTTLAFMRIISFATHTTTAVSGDTLIVTETVDSARVDSPASPQISEFFGAMEMATKTIGMIVTSQVDVRGRVYSTTGINPTNPLSGAGRGGMGALPMFLLPANAVRVGDSWTDSASTPGTATETAANTIATYRLERLEQRGGSRVAVVSMNGNMATAAPGEHMTMTGEFTIDLSASRLASAAITMAGVMATYHMGVRAGAVPVRMLMTQFLIGASEGVGTSSMEAYRAYVAGMDALNRFALDSATTRFERAVRLDSNFALPHLRLRRLPSTDTAASRAHLEAAIRLAASLPPGARALVEGLSAQMRGDRPRLCQAANQLVGADSADAEGWAMLSACHRDLQVVVQNGRPLLRGDVNRALRAAERAYALAPNALASVQALSPLLSLRSGMSCVPPATAACPPERSYRVAFLPAGDSLAVVIGAWSEVRHAPPDLTPTAVEGQVARMRRMVGVVERLLATNPNSWRLHTWMAQTAQATGDLSSAEAHYGRGALVPLDPTALIQDLQGRLELALALERPAAFQSYADSLFPRVPNALTQYRSMLGRLSEIGDSSVGGRQNTAWRVLLTGVLPPSLDSLEQTMAARLSGPQRDDFLQLTTLAGFHLRHTGPALDTAARHPLKRYQAWFARGDLARARAALTEFDRELLARHPNTPDDGGWLFDAESYLDLGDTATAFARMQEFGRRWRTSIQNAVIMEMLYFQSSTPRLWGRAWLLYGDLAMARNQPADARRAYKMVVGLWEHGEAPVQPMVARARAALAQLGN